MSTPAFQPDSFSFLKTLSENNSKEWFDANKADYQRVIKKPADALRAALCKGLCALTGREMTSKQFRINRDLRFSRDKTPYNTHVRMAFWPVGGVFEGKEAQPPGFFLSIEADHVRYGTGCMAFSKPVLGAFLHTLETGAADALPPLLTALDGQGFERSKPDLANVPRGFPKTHPLSDLARHKGLAVWATLDDTSQVIGADASQNLIELWQPTLAFWTWLTDLQLKA